jgi:hypothetical protein
MLMKNYEDEQSLSQSGTFETSLAMTRFSCLDDLMNNSCECVGVATGSSLDTPTHSHKLPSQITLKPNPTGVTARKPSKAPSKALCLRIFFTL